MSTSIKAVFNVDQNLSLGNLVFEIEQYVAKYIRSHANPEGSHSVNFRDLRKQGYRSPETSVMGTSGTAGFSLFTTFALGEAGQSIHRKLQTCITHPIEEFPVEIQKIYTPNTVLLSIGDWGDAEQILQGIAERLAIGSYYLIPENSSMTEHAPGLITPDPLANHNDRTNTANRDPQIG